MKKFLLSIIFILLIIISYISYNYYSSYSNLENDKKTIQKNTMKKNENDIKSKNNNPINKIGLYKYYGKSKDRELITEYNDFWEYHKDISSFEVYYTNEPFINNDWLPETFDEYKNNYSNIDNYRIGYQINFLTKDKEINKTILSPKDTEEFYDYLEIYLYDDYHRERGVWYSHTTEDEFNENTLLTSIKLTAGKLINDISSDITLSVFTYDYDDFDNEGNYQGNSKYTIIVKNTK